MQLPSRPSSSTTAHSPVGMQGYYIKLTCSEVSFWTSTVMFRICKVHVPNLHARVKHGEVENKKGRVVRILQVDRHFYSPH